jgi:hypothetical protein
MSAIKRGIGAGLAVLLCSLPFTAALADDDKVVVATLLELKDKRAILKLESGEELSGIVASADDETVRLTELSGMEYFDAVVRTERIEAVVLRRVTP